MFPILLKVAFYDRQELYDYDYEYSLPPPTHSVHFASATDCFGLSSISMASKLRLEFEILHILFPTYLKSIEENFLNLPTMEADNNTHLI